MHNFISAQAHSSKSKPRRKRDHFQLPKFTSNLQSGKNRVHSSLKPKKKYLNYRSSNLNSVYKNVKISREFHSSGRKNGSFYKKRRKKLLRKSRSKVNIFETLGNAKSGFNSRASSKHDKNFILGSNLRKSDGNFSRNKLLKTYNNFLGSQNYLKNNDMLRKRSKKKFDKNQFVVNTISNDSLFTHRDEFMSRSTLLGTRESRSHRKKNGKDDGLFIKDISAKSWVGKTILFIKQKFFLLKFFLIFF